MSDDKNNTDNTEHQTHKEIDEVTGVETTGHEWDGLKELNNPLPRWWLWIFYATIIWSIWYWVIYPAWPTLSGATEGMGGYTQYGELEESQGEIVARQQAYLDRFEGASFKEIMDVPELYAFATAGGASAGASMAAGAGFLASAAGLAGVEGRFAAGAAVAGLLFAPFVFALFVDVTAIPNSYVKRFA